MSAHGYPKWPRWWPRRSLPAATAKTLDVVSEGLCLILARGRSGVLQVAAQLAPILA